jgi:4-alpha-glucanotransferase
MSGQARADLHRLAHACGVRRAYTDGFGRGRTAPFESILAVLRAMGHDVRRPEDAPGALDRLRARRARRLCEPIAVVWAGQPARLRLTDDPARNGSPAGTVLMTIELEDGRVIEHSAPVQGMAVPLPSGLPIGIHRLSLQIGPRTASATVLSAPPRCYQPGRPEHSLGLFLPLHALRTDRDWGVGDLGDLERLLCWSASLGCSYVGTLPLLACYLDEPFDPSPYAPVTRLHWNELFADVTAARELEHCPKARQLLQSQDVARQLADLRAGELVDYRAAWAAKWPVFRLLADAAFSSPDGRARLEAMCRAHPDLPEYARFRAAAKRARAGWPAWPQPARAGELNTGGYDDADYRTFLYAQCLVRRQIDALADEGADLGCRLYLDLALGAEGGGYDTWKYRGQFALDAGTGAPPDALFQGGQNWGFPPPHPDSAREQGYSYFIASIRNHLKHCGALRIDHVMALHRLYWIPRGGAGADGVYVQYPAEEMYAILCIESHRTKTRIIGENLGTVPRSVNLTLQRRGILGMSVAIFEMDPHAPDQGPPAGPDGRRRRGVLPDPAPDTLACLNTHDTPTFAAYWRALDADLRLELGLIDEKQAADERWGRGELRAAVLRALGVYEDSAVDDRTTMAALHALLNHLARGGAEMLLVNMEDLWLETRPQNVPGITEGHPNWRGRAARTLEQIQEDGSIRELILGLARARPRIQSPATL